MAWSSSLSSTNPTKQSTSSSSIDHSQVNKLDISFLVDNTTPLTSTLPTPTLPSINPPLLSTSSNHDDEIQFKLEKPINPSYLVSTIPSIISSPISSVTYPDTLCRQCAFMASSIADLDRHVRITHRVKPFACRVCHKRFAERGNANKHYRVAHLKQRNHKCGTCGRCFAFRDGLNRHISMVHLNQRPFECTECMCPSGPHDITMSCTHICGMRFKQKSHRRRHILSVHHAAGKRSIHSRPTLVFPHVLTSTNTITNTATTSNPISIMQSQQQQQQQQ